MHKSWIRTIYLYLFSLLGLVLIIIGAVRMIDLGLKVYIFTEADKEMYRYMPAPIPPDGVETKVTPETDKILADNLRSNRQRDAAGALALIIVGLPLYLYHWMIIKRDKKES